MRPFREMPAEDIRKLKYVLCDIDDTITSDGKLPAESYTALWKLHDAGIQVIPVTGRPAGWCDLIVRQWPVRAVVGENGAFVFYFEDGHLKTYTHPSVEKNPAQKLAAVRDAALAAVPGCRVSKDQFSRIYDVAIDFREDPPYLTFEDAERIREVCESLGATAKVSSIHVNAWFGNYSKVETSELFLRDILGEGDPDGTVIFFGDSPNDEPMFGRFPNACAVANIRRFQDRLTAPPAYVTEGEAAAGFTEAVERILTLRGT